MAFDGSRAQYYRIRAKEVRELASAARSAIVKEQLEKIADEFEQLAASVERETLKP